MRPVIVSVLLLIVLTAVISLAILHWQYRTWPSYVWKQKLLRRVADLRARRRELSGPDPEDPRARADRLAADLFRRHLQSIGTPRLDEYPGIGPGTVERVRSAGGLTLDDLIHFPFESVTGIGPSKANDLRTAVAILVREARARFDAGGCPEAEEYRRKLASANAAARDRAAARQRELSAVEVALNTAEDLFVAAFDVTFWNYLFRRGTAGPTGEMMNRPLPIAAVLPPPVPVVRPAARATPPPVPVARPAVARPAPQAAAFPPSPPSRPPSAKVAAPPTDLFNAELQATRSGSSLPSSDHPLQPKLVAYAHFAFVVAKADGRIAQAEKKVIRAFLDEHFGHDPVLVRHIDPLMERTEARVPPESVAFANVKSVTIEAERLTLYRFAERIADASGERNQRERGLLARVAAAFGVTTALPVPLAATPAPSPKLAATAPLDPRFVLEIDAKTDVTPDLVRRRYHFLTDKLDPTRAAALGPEFAQMADLKRTQLRSAAESLLIPFGEPLEKPSLPPPADLRHNPDLDDVFGD